jgi:hypothetical protein
MKKKITIVDGSFRHQFSATLGSVRDHEQPKNFIWSNQSYGSTYTFYTDMTLHKAVGKRGKKVAWLLEPPSLSRSHYDNALELMDEFDYVLSFWKPYLKAFGDKGLFYPLGGSWIFPHHQNVYEKYKKTCIIVSQKTGAVGHRKRHSFVANYAERLGVDVYGRGYEPFENKAHILKDYQYAIVIESWSGKDYFSEKLIDAISAGCVPIYNGCPTIKEYFNRSGIITFDNLRALETIVAQVASSHDYQMRTRAIEENFERCKQFQCVEDWMYDHYGFLFT